ncbi:MAG: insulinase family protein [Prevotellaceae bacterium]|nr:insulinase family protein [Prevotellaceae bacterium]
MRKVSSMVVSLFLVGASFSVSAAAKSYTYESVPGDPLEARIYTLANGMKVYMAKNTDEPRIQTYVTVRAGGKNDPHESTGLAHYLEHLMFKGTTHFGALDYSHERPLLDSIRAQYEVYGHTTDNLLRKGIYHHIDSLSHEASRYAIANEYDKLMAAIGSNGSNAFTSVDCTVYTEDIPSNEVSRWARVQADRFQNMVIRGFHTELEAVYEEYNLYLTRDYDKVEEAINKMLYPHHPYGMQTVIGKQEHLKNPSLENVLDFYHTWYVPNNVAICMSGDIENPDSIVGIIDHYFGSWKPSRHLPELQYPQESPITSPVTREVMGRESEMVALAWRFPAARERDTDVLRLISRILSNGRAGLFDVDLEQSQQLLSASAYLDPMSDYSTLFAFAMPKEGQTLEQARDLMLAEFDKLRRGDFDESLLPATISNMRRERMSLMEDNQRIVDLLQESFVNGIPWQDQVEELDRLSRVTKADIVRFASEYLVDNYVCVLKRVGDDPNEKKIDKPEISPIEMNRDSQSQFVTDVINDTPPDIAPVFLDFSTDLSVDSFLGDNDFLYKRNSTNGLFRLTYIMDRGTKADPSLDVATQYIQYLGTRQMSLQQLQTRLYDLACNISFSAGTDRTYIVVNGLAENMAEAMRLAEQWLYEAQPDDEVYASLVDDILKARADEKLEQSSCFSHLVSYGIYGADNPLTHQLSEAELRAATPASLLGSLQSLRQAHQTIAYYGPLPEAEAKALIAKTHKTVSHPLPMANDAHFTPRPVYSSEVILAPYQAKNIYMRQYSNDGQIFQPELQPQIDLFNEYFGGGMNTVVFQELRESRGLAYSASAFYVTPRWQGQPNYFYTSIITQNDKMADCLSVFRQITEQLPLSQSSFSLAREALLKRMATERVTHADVLTYYLRCRDLGLQSQDPRAAEYQTLQSLTLDDLTAFHQMNVQGRTYTTLVLGDEQELDMEALRSLGEVRRVSLEDIFGY